jgi:hypothetical protein
VFFYQPKLMTSAAAGVIRSKYLPASGVQWLCAKF